MFVVVTLLLVGLVVWLLWQLYVRHVDSSLIHVKTGKPMPGPKPSFLGLNGLLAFYKGGMYEVASRYHCYGPVARVFIGPIVWVVVYDEAVTEFYTNNKSFQRGALGLVLNTIAPGAVLATEGQIWRKHRLAMNPFFSDEGMGHLCDDFLDIAKDEYDKLESDKPFNLYTWTTRIALRNLMKSIWKFDLKNASDEDKKQFESSQNVMGDWITLLIMAHLLCPPLAKSKYMKNYVDGKLKPWYSIIRHLKNITSEDDLWAQLSQNNYTWEEFESESVGLLLAGYETTAGSLCYTLQMISKRPDVKRKLKEEINIVLGGKKPTMESLKNLPYLDKVVLETLRYHAVVFVANRVAVEQDTLADYIIPKGYQLHTCPAFNLGYSSNTFDPDRFTEENYKEDSKKALAGFALGPHKCIGIHLALLELKLTLVWIIQNGHLDVDPNENIHNVHFPVKSPKTMTAVKKSLHP